MALDRKTVDTIAGRQIRDLMQTRHVTAEEKRVIRQRHEQAARRAEQKHAKR